MGNSISQVEFRRYIVTAYLEKYKNPTIESCRLPTSKFSNISVSVPDDIPLDNFAHLIGPCNRGRHIIYILKDVV